ncbi:MAG: hypothetical protein A2068_00865 [Ignavibacteria bacterium GWB2_35_6b]|nr:MAG: hypothetical protein A2068_00865 [Ignavibacteria bacterium GWB2_35_6b]
MDEKITTVNDCQIIDLPKIVNEKGNLTHVNNGVQVPFDVKRIYYLYDVPGGATRGGHAHKELEQFVVSVSGSFDVILDDGENRKTVRLNRSYYGLYIPVLTWREIVNFSTGAVCLVLASKNYDEQEYIRDYDEFLKTKLMFKEEIKV